MTKLRVVLNATLKRYDGSLFTDGTVFTGTISELPDEIRLAVEKGKSYLSITELPYDGKIPEISNISDDVQDDILIPPASNAEASPPVSDDKKSDVPPVLKKRIRKITK